MRAYLFYLRFPVVVTTAELVEMTIFRTITKPCFIIPRVSKPYLYRIVLKLFIWESFYVREEIKIVDEPASFR